MTIDLGSLYFDVGLKVTDVYGHLIFDQEFGITDKIYFELIGKSGLYFFKIDTRKGNKIVFRIVKE